MGDKTNMTKADMNNNFDKLMDDKEWDDSVAEDTKENEDDEAISLRSQLVIDLVAEFNRKGRLKSVLVENKRDVSEFDKAYKYPEHIAVERIHMTNFEMELLTWRFSGSPWVILQFHGGGYLNAWKNRYRTIAGLYSEVGKGARVLSIDYRVAPDHPFPAALEDAFEAYSWLLEQGYKEEDIVLAGDSAGGGLCMALCHYLKQKGMNLPAGIIAMSPWTDLTASGPSYVEKADEDPIFGGGHAELIYENPYVGDHDPKDPCMSPLFGDFTGFPPMLIQVGTSEMLLSDSQQVAQKAREAGVLVRLSEYPGMFHVFQMAGKMMKESRKAWVEIGRFFEVLENMRNVDRE